MITSLGIDHFWDHINQIERQQGINEMIYQSLFTPIRKIIKFWRLLLVVNLPAKKKLLNTEESLAEVSALDSLSPRIGMSPEHSVKMESSQ